MHPHRRITAPQEGLQSRARCPRAEGTLGSQALVLSSGTPGEKQNRVSWARHQHGHTRVGGPAGRVGAGRAAYIESHGVGGAP